MLLFYILIFLFSCFLLLWVGSWIVKSLMKIARFLGWKEFVVAFVLMAFAGSLPNLFVDVSAALYKIPQLAFGEIVGGNVADLTLAVALAALIAGGIPTNSRTVQSSLVFTIAIAILPLALILDGTLGRGDGIILIFVFIFYVYWLFSKKERFSKVYEENKKIEKIRNKKDFLKEIGKLVFGIGILFIASQGIIKSVFIFARNFNISFSLIGIFIIGLANSLPETYCSILSARKGQTWMILGDLMGAVIIPATLVLGIVALVYPIEVSDFSPFAVARLFMIISALVFFLFVKTERKITRNEAVILLGIYIAFLLVEIITK